ncbi:hypothetical protein L211DRAFT_871873 [Terfezia boudieri ATCC MYA-4762]|uniref:Uncharacterized protein n=1 Tax=Terfezia boudieri ATCC MYA-4762 TaxID=1051890 RepID=A0A3N4L5W6_9PEZI|nr:hypothetical protein L211DRAFT_871873 [Terfezia boudieri ATCC MYA-4762]
MQTKRKHENLTEEMSLLPNGRLNPLPSLKLKLDQKARSFRDDIIPSRIEYLQSIISTFFNLPFWESADASHVPEAIFEGPMYKKSKIDINALHEQAERTLVTVPKLANLTCTELNKQLEEKLEILKTESKYLASMCSSLQLREALNTSRSRGRHHLTLISSKVMTDRNGTDDSLLEIFTATQQQALKLRSCLAKVYEERATLLSGRVMGNGNTEQAIQAGFEKALDEYDKRIEELTGCQAVTLIASYVSILDALGDFKV